MLIQLLLMPMLRSPCPESRRAQPLGRETESTMRSIAIAIAFLAAIAAPAGAQQTEDDAANGRWVALFNKGGVDGVASLDTPAATRFRPRSAVVRGRAASGA